MYVTEDAPADVVVLDVLVEDLDGRPASVEDAAAWRDAFGLSFDVLADSDRIWVRRWGDPDGGPYDQHSYTVLNSDGTVAWHRAGFGRDVLIDIVREVEAAY